MTVSQKVKRILDIHKLTSKNLREQLRSLKTREKMADDQYNKLVTALDDKLPDDPTDEDREDLDLVENLSMPDAEDLYGKVKDALDEYDESIKDCEKALP